VPSKTRRNSSFENCQQWILHINPNHVRKYVFWEMLVNWLFNHEKKADSLGHNLRMTRFLLFSDRRDLIEHFTRWRADSAPKCQLLAFRNPCQNKHTWPFPKFPLSKSSVLFWKCVKLLVQYFQSYLSFLIKDILNKIKLVNRWHNSYWQINAHIREKKT